MRERSKRRARGTWTALARIVAPADELIDHPFERAELGDSRSYVLRVDLRDLARFRTRAITIFDDPEQRAYVLDLEPELAAAADEGHAPHVVVVIAPLCAAAPWRRQ